MTRLFHHIYPVPECQHCNKQQMVLAGNLAIDILGFSCPLCFKRISTKIEFVDGWPEQTEEVRLTQEDG
ncbi:hypothetical protein LCGC14_1647230 [marine sediment metagenome]|uniref:Uncharacterized protein n=1 Tax=marine sediment metagenome TaxID=412755 RepID=A0A0F9KDS0_9ZZZZ